jgi:hypothetical protein
MEAGMMEDFVLALAKADGEQPGKTKPRRDASPDLLAFRERILQLIEEAGSEAALERRAGLPVGSLSHYSRRNPYEPRRPALVAIAKCMDLQLNWLCMGEGPKRRPEQLDVIACCGINDL